LLPEPTPRLHLIKWKGHVAHHCPGFFYHLGNAPDLSLSSAIGRPPPHYNREIIDAATS
jgi:hypothetical protein